MERFIRYKRFESKLTPEELQEFFNKLIADGFEIIYYNENKEPMKNIFGNEEISIVVVAGKKQESELKKIL
jgi:hypothetical protein